MGKDMRAKKVGCSNGTKSSPTVRWYAHLAGDLGDTDSDVLFLLDCCSSGGSRGCSKSGMKELIAACGYETAPAPGKHSFTTSLIEELWDLSRGPPFSVAHLHDKISARLQHWSPYLDAENLGRRDKEGQDIERRTAPVHFLMNSQVDSSSIVLKPLSSPAPASPSASPGQGSGTSAGPPPKRIKLSPRDNGPHPQVLISVVLGEDYKDGAEIFSDWLCKVPGKVESVHIQAAFHHGSTLLLVSMPIAVWDLLPSHQAYSLVEFVKSDNLLLPPVSTESSSPARQINNPTTSSGIASLSSSAGSWQTSSAATARQKIANDGRAEFVNFLQERNVDLHKSADHMGRNFWGRSLTEPPLTLTGEAGRRWEADLHRNDVDFQGVIKKFLIVHRFTLGSSLAYAWNLQWQCDPVPSKYRHQHDRMPLPKPSSIVALNSRCYFHSTNVGKLTSMICAEAGQEENDPQAFPFLSVEPVNDSCEAAIGKNLHTASQALHNMYVFMKAAGYESVFFEKVRFYSAVISSGGFEVRVHRAVKLDQGRIYPDYPLGFRFDQVLMKDSAYTRKDLATVIKTVLVTYGLEILLPVLQNAVLYRCTEDDEISGAEAKTEV